MSNKQRSGHSRFLRLGHRMTQVLMVLLWIFGLCSYQPAALAANLSETSTPAMIAQLATAASGTPQIFITSPRPEEVLTTDTVRVNLQVSGIAIFKNATLGLGPHLHLLLDGTPQGSIYDLGQPITLDHLTPGTHTLQVLANKPWHESWKNPGALAQVTFHVLAKSAETPNPLSPRLVFTPPSNFGAEPFLLDFYLANAPSHTDPQHPQRLINDWQVRVTINNQSFLLDRWPPFYLQGLVPGANLIKLEYLDHNSQVLDSSIRIVTYRPNGRDSFSQLLRNEMPLAQAITLFDPNSRTLPVVAPIPVVPIVTPAPVVAPSPVVPVAIPSFTPAPVATPSPVAPVAIPSLTPAPVVAPSPVAPVAIPSFTPAPVVAPSPVAPVAIPSLTPAPVATPSPVAPVAIPSLTPAPVVTPSPIMPVAIPSPIASSPEPILVPQPILTSPVTPVPNVQSTTPVALPSSPLPIASSPSLPLPSPTSLVPVLPAPVAHSPSIAPPPAPSSTLLPAEGEEVVEFKVILRELLRTTGVRVKQFTNQIPPLVSQWSQDFSHWVSDRIQAMSRSAPTTPVEELSLLSQDNLVN